MAGSHQNRVSRVPNLNCESLPGGLGPALLPQAEIKRRRSGNGTTGGAPLWHVPLKPKNRGTTPPHPKKTQKKKKTQANRIPEFSTGAPPLSMAPLDSFPNRRTVTPQPQRESAKSSLLHSGHVPLPVLEHQYILTRQMSQGKNRRGTTPPLFRSGTKPPVHFGGIPPFGDKWKCKCLKMQQAQTANCLEALKQT